MVVWLLLGSVVYLLTLYVPSLFLITGIGVGGYFGARDNEEIIGAVHGRAARAARNFQENYPVFMGLGILALVVPAADQALAATGAMVFVLARLVYLPIYLMGVPFLRSAVFMIGWLGLIAMGVAVI